MRATYWEARLKVLMVLFAARIWAVTKVKRLLGLKPAAHMYSFWTVRHRDAQGRLIYADFGPNIFHDEGEEFAVKALFTEEESVPANYYLGLDNRSSPAEGDALADLSGEPSGNGYSRVAVASDATDFTAQQDGGTSDWEAVTKTCTFTADGGSIGPVQQMFLATSSDGTGKLICTRALSQSRTLADGESLACTLTVRIGE